MTLTNGYQKKNKDTELYSPTFKSVLFTSYIVLLITCVLYGCNVPLIAQITLYILLKLHFCLYLRKHIGSQCYTVFNDCKFVA